MNSTVQGAMGDRQLVTLPNGIPVPYPELAAIIKATCASVLAEYATPATQKQQDVKQQCVDRIQQAYDAARLAVETMVYCSRMQHGDAGGSSSSNNASNNSAAHAAALAFCCNPACTNLSGCKEADLPLSACSRCKVVVYCSKGCQKAAWPLHKHVCCK
jgi:hypothetical protein